MRYSSINRKKIVEELQRGEALSIDDLARLTGVNKSTVKRRVMELKNELFIRVSYIRKTESEGYFTSERVYELQPTRVEERGQSTCPFLWKSFKNPHLDASQTTSSDERY